MGKSTNKNNRNARIIFGYHRYICVYCKERFPFNKLTREHIFTRKERGTTKYGDWRNIVPACAPCNVKRGGTPLSEEKKKELLKLARTAIAYRDLIFNSNRNTR